jgi:hypothetical protein
MKRLLILACLLGVAIYMFISWRTAPEQRSEAVQAKHDVRRPLLTSWGPTLQSLRQEPAVSSAVSQAASLSQKTVDYGSAPDPSRAIGAHKLTTSVHPRLASPTDGRVTHEAQASASSPKHSQATKPAARIVARWKPQKPGLSAKSAVRVSDDAEVAGHRRRGLFAQGGYGRRGHGLFGFFRERKAEQSAWSIGPGG